MSVHREQIDRYKKLKAQENQVLYGGHLPGTTSGATTT